MRERFGLGLLWLVATALATWTGFTATHTVGDVIRAGAHGTEFRPASLTNQPAQETNPETATFNYRYGQLTVRCSGSVATVDEKQPESGWTIADFERGPDEDVDITFTKGRTLTRIEVYCNDGTPTPILSERTP